VRRSLAVAAALSLTVASAGAATVGASAASHRAGTTGLRGIPTGAPPAAYLAEPTLPKPHGWPFSESFPRTSGTGREAHGAAFWSDFVYDDHGAAGAQVQQPVASLAPTGGTYVYSNPKADNNGADIFRAAVGLTKSASYWRIDWNTLADKTVPIAEWALDTDSDTRTGATAWPAGAGVNSPGIDRAIVVSSHGARLLDGSGRLLRTLPVTVDMNARSFVVAVPRNTLPISGTWKVRLTAGVADATGTTFAPVPVSSGALPGQPAVYNVAFRSYQQEPPVYKPSGDQGELIGNGLARGSKYGNFWMERHQSEALASGDVSAFALDLKWSDLSSGRTTPEPQPTGYTNRWYVSRLNLGQGVIANPSNSGTGDLRPNFLGRIQPYAVYVPTTYDPAHKTPLTWILHSLSVQHNQYGALDPSMIQQECEDRQSICATTLGYGPDGWYFDEAEFDFWAVWHQLALAYDLDPERTVISGYSMGGFASYKLGLEYPDLFAKAMPLAGPPGCGLRASEQIGGAAGSGRCTTAGDTTPMIVNARWVPYVLGDGIADELVPVSSVLEQVQKFLDDGNRIHFELYPAEDHLVYATQDGFSSEIAKLGTTTRVVNPGHITYAWWPTLQDPKLQFGPTGAYWVRGLAARSSSALASLDVTSLALSNPTITTHQSASANVPGDPTPASVVDQTWTLGPGPKPSRTIRVTLTNVASLGIDMVRARVLSGTVAVTTDGATVVRLLHLRPGTVVRGGSSTVRAGRDGTAVVSVASGTHILTIG
jgi:pimeloyl-ACP methyl ester carboxylesterase